MTNCLQDGDLGIPKSRLSLNLTAYSPELGTGVTGVESKQPKVLTSKTGKEGVSSLERNANLSSLLFVVVLYITLPTISST